IQGGITMARQWRRIVGLLTVISMLGILLAACGGGGATQGRGTTGGSTTTSGGTGGSTTTSGGTTGANTTTSGGAASAGSCPDSAKGQQINMWSPLTGPDGNVMT